MLHIKSDLMRRSEVLTPYLKTVCGQREVIEFSSRACADDTLHCVCCVTFDVVIISDDDCVQKEKNQIVEE